MEKSNRSKLVLFIILLTFGLSACAGGGHLAAVNEDSDLKIVATTTFVGDVVSQIAGERSQITVLLVPGQNPHAYQPAPRDMVRISDADLVFANGFGLEEFLADLLEGADNTGALVELSAGVDPLYLDVDDHADGKVEDESDHQDLGIDPHVWFDPNNIFVWTDTIAEALAEADPEGAAVYRENAASYQAELAELDSWIREQVASIPPENRKLVTDHTSFGYFAEEYGFQQVGAVIPAPTTEAETSGRQLAELMETIREFDVKAVFVSVDIDPTMAEIVTEETGVELIPLYFGSLTEGGPADSYLSFMRYNVEAIVSALNE